MEDTFDTFYQQSMRLSAALEEISNRLLAKGRVSEKQATQGIRWLDKREKELLTLKQAIEDEIKNLADEYRAEMQTTQDVAIKAALPKKYSHKRQSFKRLIIIVDNLLASVGELEILFHEILFK